MTETRIRHIERSNIAELIEIARQTNLSPWTAQNYLDELQLSGSIMLRLETEPRETIGFVVGRVIEGAIEHETQAEIYNIAIVEPHQRRGHGQILFDEFTQKCLEKDVVSIWLEVRESNRQAIDFYQKNGFEPVQTRPNFYENPREHAVLMRLTLK